MVRGKLLRQRLGVKFAYSLQSIKYFLLSENNMNLGLSPVPPNNKLLSNLNLQQDF